MSEDIFQMAETLEKMVSGVRSQVSGFMVTPFELRVSDAVFSVFKSFNP